MVATLRALRRDKPGVDGRDPTLIAADLVGFNKAALRPTLGASDAKLGLINLIVADVAGLGKRQI